MKKQLKKFGNNQIKNPQKILGGSVSGPIDRDKVKRPKIGKPSFESL